MFLSWTMCASCHATACFVTQEAEQILAKLHEQRRIAAADQASADEPVTASPKHAAPPEFTPEKVAKPGAATLGVADDADSEKVPVSDPYLAAADSDTEYFSNFEDYKFALWVKGLGLDFDGSITPTEPESDGEVAAPDMEKNCLSLPAPSANTQAGHKATI